jgi:hypothetical protein
MCSAETRSSAEFADPGFQAAGQLPCCRSNAFTPAGLQCLPDRLEFLLKLDQARAAGRDITLLGIWDHRQHIFFDQLLILQPAGNRRLTEGIAGMYPVVEKFLVLEILTFPMYSIMRKM